MTDPDGSGLFSFGDVADLGRVRDVLDAAGYDDQGIVGTLGPDITASLTAKRLPALLRRTSGGTPLETLIRLFILGVPVDQDAAAAALAPMAPAWWAERGLVRLEPARAVATVQLRCYQGLIVAFDFHRRAGAPLAADYVMGISASSLALAGMTVRRPVRTTLDLGTGSGFQAFLAAPHSHQVVATDRNPRAVEMARFNAAFNHMDNVECREGDLFEPVAGERFDLIVSNPPFIVSPDNLYYFMHSGMEGDEICRTLVRQAPEFLEDGGFCQFLANWAVGTDEEWQDRLARWVQGTGCDALVLRRGRQSLEDYATVWVETGDDDPERHRSAFDAWMDYYERLGIEAIDSGLITLRRASEGTPWFRAEDAPESMTFPCGDDLARSFELRDFLVTAGDDATLLATVLRLNPDVRLDQRSQPCGDGWEVVSSQLRRVEGLHHSGNIDVQGAQALARCDGTRPLGEVLAELAAVVGDEFDTLVPTWLAVVRALIERGFLLPEE